MPRRFIDVSHTVHDGLVTYPGLPAPRISDHLSRAASQAHYAPGTEFHIGRIDMVTNTGTYVDVPSHRYARGADLAEVPLDRLADLEVVMVRRRRGSERAIDAAAFARVDVRGRAVLIHTGWDAKWATPAYGEGHPFVTADGARALVDGGAALVGIDSLNIDDTEDPARPAHTTLLGAGVPICEHLTGLAEVPDVGGRLFAVPVKVAGLGSFPVRAFVVAPAER